MNHSSSKVVSHLDLLDTSVHVMANFEIAYDEKKKRRKGCINNSDCTHVAL